METTLEANQSNVISMSEYLSKKSKENSEKKEETEAGTTADSNSIFEIAKSTIDW